MVVNQGTCTENMKNAWKIFVLKPEEKKSLCMETFGYFTEYNTHCNHPNLYFRERDRLGKINFKENTSFIIHIVYICKNWINLLKLLTISLHYEYRSSTL
jgi:hypothetical protein